MNMSTLVVFFASIIIQTIGVGILRKLAGVLAG
jgi:hypothetical protein